MISEVALLDPKEVLDAVKKIREQSENRKAMSCLNLYRSEQKLVEEIAEFFKFNITGGTRYFLVTHTMPIAFNRMVNHLASLGFRQQGEPKQVEVHMAGGQCKILCFQVNMVRK